MPALSSYLFMFFLGVFWDGGLQFSFIVFVVVLLSTLPIVVKIARGEPHFWQITFLPFRWWRTGLRYEGNTKQNRTILSGVGQ